MKLGLENSWISGKETSFLAYFILAAMFKVCNVCCPLCVSFVGQLAFLSTITKKFKQPLNRLPSSLLIACDNRLPFSCMSVASILNFLRKNGCKWVLSRIRLLFTLTRCDLNSKFFYAWNNVWCDVCFVL